MRFVHTTLACCGALALGPASAPAAATEADAPGAPVLNLVRKVEARYRELGAFRVSVVQSYASATFGAEEESRGTIHVTPPGRLLWEYDEPKGQRGVFDGTTWWLVDPREREVRVRERQEGEPEPLADLLAGRIDLLSVFAPRFPGADPSPPGRRRVELLPRDLRDDIDLVVMEVDVATGTLQRLDVLDPLGNRMTYRLGAPTREAPRPDAAFEVTVPEGYLLTHE